ncbi:MAG: hypothetical protein Q8K60_09480, partial [Parachlamydiaceae bacterium]|nr:hypothetical protein [Parachlamydiaceae bacterium]
KNISLSEKVSLAPVVSLNLRTLFRHYFDLTHVNCLNYIQESEKKAVHIKEIYWIGSSVLKNIGKEAVIFLIFEILNGNFSQETIRRWFSQAPHLVKFFLDEENDLDFRVVFEGDDNNCSKELSLQVVRKIASMIKEHDIKIIEANYPKLSNMPFHLYQDFNWSESYVLNSPLLAKRKTVHEPHLKFSIVALNTDTIPIDINIVGSMNGVLTLENPNLSSRNCFAIPTRQLVNSQKTRSIEISTQQYGPQAFLDLLFNCFRPSTYNLDGWRYFLRKCIRMGNQNDEIKMINNILQSKEWYLNQKDWKKTSLTQVEARSLSGYVYLLLEEYFIKVEADCHNQKDPYILSGFIFRACQSLSKASWISDQEIKELWCYVDQIYWNKNVRTLDRTTINGLIRRAIIDENVPFNVLSAKIGLMTWLMNPYSATIHCEQPYFYVTDENSYLMPIKIGQQCLVLNEYFSHHQVPESFMELFLLFSKKYSLSLKQFPLSHYHEELEIDLNVIKKIYDQWLNHSSPFVNTLGMLLYLSFYQISPNSLYFSQMVATLPSLVKNLNHQQKNEVLKTFDAIITTHSEIQSSLAVNYFKLKEDQSHEWMEGLIKSNHPLLIEIGFSLWKANRNFLREKKWHDFNWDIFHSIVPHHFNLSLSLYRTLQKFFPINMIQTIDEVHLICSIHLQSPLVTSELRNLGQLFNPFLDNIDPIDFRDDAQRALFSLDLSQLILKLFNDHLEDMGEDLLIRCSQKKYLADYSHKLWMYRINQLIQKKSYPYATTLFALAHENKWMMLESLDSRVRNRLMMHLNQSLLVQNSEMMRSIIVRESDTSITQKENWVFHSIFSYLEKNHFKFIEGDKGFIILLIKITPPKMMLQTSHLILESLQLYLTEESFLKKDSSIQLIDELLFHEKMEEIILCRGPEWKLFLLDYLQQTHTLQIQTRIKDLWGIYLIVLKIFKINRSKQILLYDQLALLMNASVESLVPVQLREWIKLHGKNIFELLFTNKHLKEAQLFLISIVRLNLSCNNMGNDKILKRVWELSRCNSDKPSDALIDYFCSQSFEKSFSHLKKRDSIHLRLIVEKLFSSYPSNSDLNALKWLNLCLKHSVIEKTLSKELYCQVEKKIANTLEISKYSTENFLLIINVIQSLKIKNEKIWLMLWQKIENEKINHQESLICSKALETFKEITNEKEGGECFVNCLKHVFQCMTLVKNLELFKFIENQDWQHYFIKDATIHPLFYPTLTALFLGVTQLVDSNSFDQKLIENILIQKKRFSEDRTFNKWNQAIEKALLQKFKSSRIPSGIKVFAELMASHLKCFSLNKKNDYYDLFVSLIKSFMTLPQELLGEADIGDESLVDIFKFIAKSNALSIDEKINLIHLYDLKVHQKKKYIIEPLVLVILEKGIQKKIGFLKSYFFPIFYEMIQNHEITVDQIDHFFNLAINKFTLNKKENENIHFLKFISSIDRLTILVKDDSTIQKMVLLYTETVPYFFSNQENVLQALKLVLPFVMQYGKGQDLKSEEKEKFISFLFLILNISNNSPQEESPFKSISTSYYWKILEILNQEKGLNFEFIDDALIFFLKSTIDMVKEKKLKSFEAISRLEPIMYFFSTVYIDESNKILEVYKFHFLKKQQIFALAYIANVFSRHQLNLFMLETWLNMKIDDYSFTDHEMSTKECQHIFHLIDLILINPSKQMSNILQAIELIIWLIIKLPTSDIDQLISYFSKIFNSIYAHSDYSFSEADRILLYSFFIHGTDEKLIKKLKAEKQDKLLSKLGKFNQTIDLLFYNRALDSLNSLMNKSESGSEQAFYVTWALKKIIECYQYGIDDKKIQFIKYIQTLTPFVKKIAFQHEFKLLKYSHLQEYDFNKLINVFVVTLIEYADFNEYSKPIYINNAFNDQRKEILFDWFRSIKSPEENFNKDLVCDALLMTWINILAKAEGSIFWLPFNHPDTKREIEEIKEYIENYGNTSQKYCFLLVNFQYACKYMLSDKIEFFNEFNQLIEKLKSVSNLKESISIFNIVSCFILSLDETFYKSNEEEYKKIFNKFLISLMEFALKNYHINIEKFQRVITFFVIKSFEKKILNPKDVNHILFIKWMGPYVNFNISEEPFLCFIYLIFNQEDRVESDFYNYANDLEKLFPHINEYIIQTGSYCNFQKVMKLITDIYKVNALIGKKLFLTWYYSFNGLLFTNKNGEALLNMIFCLSNGFVKETNCSLELKELIIYANDIEQKKYICSESKVFKKIFIEYFEEKRESLVQSQLEFSNFIDLYHDR